MSLVLFSGGRGNKNLLNALQCEDPNPQIKINAIVNGLDDGASTGTIRELLGNSTHGISDFLKVALAMSPRRDLASIFELRFPIIESLSDHLLLSKELHDFIFSEIDLDLLSNIDISENEKSEIRQYFMNFMDYFFKDERVMPNLSDFKLGNIVFASMLIKSDLNFETALGEFMRFCEIDCKQFGIVQSTESASFIVGTLKNGVLLPNEAAIVLTRTSDYIDKTFQISRPLTAPEIRMICSIEQEEKNNFLSNIEKIPTAANSSIQCIESSNAIVYGAGTPYSSLLPSLELKGMADAIKNTKVPKILVANLAKETANMMSGVDLINEVLNALEKSNTGQYEPRDYITHIIVPCLMEEKSDGLLNLIETKEGEIESNFDWIKVKRADIRLADNPSQHDGKRLGECILSILDGY